jgi:hypothetical protein
MPYAFLQHRRLAKAKREKKHQRTTASTKPAAPCATLSSRSSLDYHLSDARAAEDGSALVLDD